MGLSAREEMQGKENAVASGEFPFREKTIAVTTGRGCPITDVRVFRAPHIRPRHGFPDYVDVVTPEVTTGVARINGLWRADPKAPGTDAARKVMKVAHENLTSELISLRGSYSRHGGGTIEGFLVAPNRFYGTVKDSRFDVPQPANIEFVGNRLRLVSHQLINPSSMIQRVEVTAECISRNVQAQHFATGLRVQGNEIIVSRDTDVAPIADVAVIYDFERAPDGYEVIRENLRGAAAGSELYLCLRRGD